MMGTYHHFDGEYKFMISAVNDGSYLYFNKEMIDWLSKNIQGNIELMPVSVDIGHQMMLVFDNDEDAIAFKLRWT